MQATRVTFHVCLPTEIVDALRRIAVEEDRSVANVVKRALVAHIETRAA